MPVGCVEPLSELIVAKVGGAKRRNIGKWPEKLLKGVRVGHLADSGLVVEADEADDLDNIHAEKIGDGLDCEASAARAQVGVGDAKGRFAQSGDNIPLSRLRELLPSSDFFEGPPATRASLIRRYRAATYTRAAAPRVFGWRDFRLMVRCHGQ